MEPEKKSNGAMVGLVIIIIILILGGLYMWKANSSKNVELDGTGNTTVTESDTNELGSLEADLQQADVNTGVDLNTVN